MKVAFIGLGIMGSRMAARLLELPDVELTVYNRTRAHAEPLEEKGASVAASARDCVEGAEVAFTMLSTPSVVEEVAFGKEGFVRHMKPGALWVDSSTVDPAFSRRMSVRAQDAGIRFLDAPVAGTKQPAEKGELLFLVGGKRDDLEEIRSLLDAMGKKTLYLGDHGQGASMKILINLMLAQSMLAFSEAVHLGKALGFPAEKVHDVLLGAPVTAPFLSVIRGKLEAGNTEANFPLKWMHKDLKLVGKTAEELGVAMPSAAQTEALFAAAKTAGRGEEDFTSIYYQT